MVGLTAIRSLGSSYLAGMSRRGKIEIYMDILEAAQHGERATALANKALMNYRQFQKNLKELVDKGLLKLVNETKLYETTKHGRKLLKHWKKTLRLL